MITARTTIITGAGASMPYRMPSGPVLAERIVHHCRNLEMHGGPLLLAAMKAKKILRAEVDSFHRRLNDGGFDSVDALLEKEPDNERLQLVGRILIAHAMLEVFLPAIDLRAKPINHNAPARDWIRYTLNRASMGARRPADILPFLTFVTFNFDTILEENLSLFFTSHFNLGSAEARSLAEQMVLHVHGSVERILPIANIKPTDVIQAAERIGIVHDEIPDERLRDVRERIHRSEVVAFLGFGYNSDNLAKLDFPQRHSERKAPMAPSPLYASAFGIGEGERQNVIRSFGGHWALEMGLLTQDCLDYLREHDVLKDDPRERDTIRKS